ncbi:MAG: hypothetical protein ABFS39_12975 [Pseudomonadota bacterium]
MKQVVIRHGGLLTILRTVLFGFSPNLAAHFARSSSSHSYDYGFSDDQTNCFATLTENSEHS